MRKIDIIEAYFEDGRSDEFICRMTCISPESLPGYKAHITRRKKRRTEEAAETIMKYARYSDYIVIKKTDLNEEQTIALAGVLESLVKSPEDKKEKLETKIKKTKTKPRTLPENEVRNIVIELRNKGVPMKEVRNDPRLKEINPKKIAAYNAWYNMGKYTEKN